MPLLTITGPLRPTFKLTLFEREAYTCKEIVAIVRQEGRQPVELPDGTKKPALKRLWAKQDQLLVEQGQADYASVPGEDGYDPNDKLTPGWKTRHAALLRKLAVGKVDATGDEVKKTKQEKENAEVNMTDVDDADEEPITGKRTIAEMMQDLEKWGRPHKGVRRAEPLRAIWVSEIRARRRKEAQEDRDAESDKVDDDADAASDPEFLEASGAPLKKRKRKETSNDQSIRKRTKAGATKSVEVEEAVHDVEPEDEDVPMIDAENQAPIKSKPQRKKAIPKKMSAGQVQSSKRNAASKSTVNDIVLEVPEQQPMEVSKRMENSKSQENTVAIQGEGEIERPTEGRTLRAAGRKATAAPPILPEPSGSVATVQKKRANLDITDDEEEDEDEDSDSDSEETFAAPSRRGGLSAASKAPATTTPSLRADGAPAQNAAHFDPAHETAKKEEKEFWVPKHNTDPYCNITLERSRTITNTDTLPYPLLISHLDNLREIARLDAEEQGLPPPVTPKKPEPYDYRKDKEWYKHKKRR